LDEIEEALKIDKPIRGDRWVIVKVTISMLTIVHVVQTILSSGFMETFQSLALLNNLSGTKIGITALFIASSYLLSYGYEKFKQNK